MVNKECLIRTKTEAIGCSWLQYTPTRLYGVIVQKYNLLLTVVKIFHHRFFQIFMLFNRAQGRAVWGVNLPPLACWDCGFDPHRGHGYLSLLNVVFCEVKVSAMGRSPVQRSPNECGVSECDREASTVSEGERRKTGVGLQWQILHLLLVGRGWWVGGWVGESENLLLGRMPGNSRSSFCKT